MKFSATGRLSSLALWPFLAFGATGVVWGQEITFDLEISVDGVAFSNQTIGLRADALPGFDHHDVPAPPSVPDAYFDSYLVMFEPPADLPNKWLLDFRPLGDLTTDRVELWEMDLAASVSGLCTITITEPAPNLVPHELDFFGPGVDFQKIGVPGSISFPLSPSFLVFFWELRLADEVDVARTTWGGVKSLYR